MKVYFLVRVRKRLDSKRTLRLEWADKEDGFQPRVGRQLSQRYCEDRGYEGLVIKIRHVFPAAICRELEKLHELLEEVNVDITEVMQPIVDAAIRVISRKPC